MVDIAINNDKDAPKISDDDKVGEILKRTRVHYEQTVADIENALRIRAAQIKAIEEDDHSTLPARVYTLGFVKTYAEYLGLNGAEMVEKFKAQNGAEEPEPVIKEQKPVMASENQLPPWWVIMLSIAGVIAILAFWLSENQKDREMVENIPSVPKEIKSQMNESDQSQNMLLESEITTAPMTPIPEDGAQTQEATPEPQIITEAPKEGIIINIIEESWVEIREKEGKILMSKVLKADEQYHVPDRPDLTISTGNAGGVTLQLNGEDLGIVGKRGSVIQKMSLNGEYLKSNYPIKDENTESEDTPSESTGTPE